MPKFMRRTLGPAVLAFVITACSTAGAPPDAVPQPTVTPPPAAPPAATPTPDPSSCTQRVVQEQPLPETVAMQASISPVIVVGTFRGKGPGFWFSPSGNAPKDKNEQSQSQILTNLNIDADTIVRGDQGKKIRGTVSGGTVGCASETWSDPLILENGQRYLLFGVGPSEDNQPKDWTLFYTAWPVGADDIVETPTEGSKPLDELVAEIANYPVLGPGDPLPFPTPDPNQPQETPDTRP